MGRVLRSVVGLLGLASAAGSASVDAVDAGPAAVQLRPYVGHLQTVPVAIGRFRLTLLLDTGGGQTLITPRVAAMLGCTPHGRSVGFRMGGERVEFTYCDDVALEIAGRSFKRSQVAVWDVMSVLPAELPPLDGVLALDVLDGRPFTLDLARATLTLESPSSLKQRRRGGRSVTARVASGPSGAERTILLRGRLEEAGWFLFDSANLDAIQAAPHMMAAGGKLSRQVDAATLTLDGLPAFRSRVRVRELIHDGALSEEFLRSWVWTVDMRRGDVWVAAAPVRR